MGLCTRHKRVGPIMIDLRLMQVRPMPNGSGTQSYAMGSRKGGGTGVNRARACLAAAWAAALLGLAPNAPARVPHGVGHEHYRQGAWRLEVARDRFSGAIACRLQAHRGRQIYRMGAVGFAVGARNQAEAAYRIDFGDPVPARNDVPRLIALQVPFERGGMDNPAGGYVWIPFDRLRAANSVAIEPRPGARPRQVRLDGLTALHDRAVAQGCTPDTVFVER